MPASVRHSTKRPGSARLGKTLELTAAGRLVRSLFVVVLVAGAATATAATAVAHGPRGVVADRSSIGGLRVGDPVARALRLWRRPDRTIRRGGVVSYRWRNDEGMLAYVRARADRIFSIEVEGPVFGTPRGDGYGTGLAQFRRHWPGARRYRDCCAVAVSHYAVGGLRPATVLVFTFASGRLTRVALMSGLHFEACYVNKCD